MLENAPHQDPEPEHESPQEVDDGSSMATTLSLGDAWHPLLRGSPLSDEVDPNDNEEAGAILKPETQKVDGHIESAKKDLNIPVFCLNKI